MRRLLILCLGAFLAAACARDGASTTGESAAAGDVLFSLELKEDGKALATFPEAGEDGVLGRFIHTAGLTAGLGSNPIGLDRGLGDAGRVVVFRIAGGKLVLEQENWEYRASADNPAERRAVRNSFASSVLWAGKLEEDAPAGRVAVDIAPFLASDAMNVAGRLKARGQGSYALDKDRSFVEPAGVLLFPDNVEVDAAITFSGAEPGDEVSEVAADGRSFTLTLHHSFVRLPEDGFRSREFDSRVGVIDMAYYDYSAPLAGQVQRAFARRFRLQRVDPAAEKGPVKKPIIFYVDNGAPEPIRSALVEGASWWAEAFEAAGFEDAYRVEVLPEDAHPMDARYNVIQWVHRQTRGWSYGGGAADPRTGEMLKARVILGSQRVRQDRMIFEGLAGTDKTGSGAPDDPLQLSLARIRQLSAHEVGHTLGFAHNFAASTNDRASVMDYPAPLVRPGNESGLDFSEAYGVGVGPWDAFATKWLYAEFPEGVDEAAALEDMIDDAYASGLRFVDDAHGRSTGAAHPYGSVWDNGADPVAMLDETMEVRARALAGFGERVLKAGEPTSRMREVIAPIYLYHRYQTAAAAKLIGGYAFRHAEKGDPDAAGSPVAPDRQRAALDALLKTVDARALALPSSVSDRLSPTIDAGYGWAGGKEQFDGATGAMFDVSSAANAAASMTFSAIFHPARVARVIETGRRGDDVLTLEEMFEASEAAVFRGEGVDAEPVIARVAQGRFAATLMDLAASDVSPEIAARTDGYLKALSGRIRPSLIEGASDDRAFREWLVARIAAHLDRPAPSSAPAPAAIAPPPGSPIGSPNGAAESCWHCDPLGVE